MKVKDTKHPACLTSLATWFPSWFWCVHVLAPVGQLYVRELSVDRITVFHVGNPCQSVCVSFRNLLRKV